MRGAKPAWSAASITAPMHAPYAARNPGSAIRPCRDERDARSSEESATPRGASWSSGAFASPAARAAPRTCAATWSAQAGSEASSMTVRATTPDSPLAAMAMPPAERSATTATPSPPPMRPRSAAGSVVQLVRMPATGASIATPFHAVNTTQAFSSVRRGVMPAARRWGGQSSGRETSARRSAEAFISASEPTGTRSALAIEREAGTTRTTRVTPRPASA